MSNSIIDNERDKDIMKRPEGLVVTSITSDSNSFLCCVKHKKRHDDLFKFLNDTAPFKHIYEN